MRKYVIITPAHNEEAFIEKTIQSVLSQSVAPLRWVVVNDGSTDRTRTIVEQYLPNNSFIELINAERPGGRHFGNKVNAFNMGLTQVDDVDYEYIGNLDADISLSKDYFENLLTEFDRDLKLGLAGGMVSSSIDGKFVSQNVALDSVAGAVQLFRRACFEQIGGYLALPQGGIDAAAEIMARMNGWNVRTLPELSVLEHRRTGTATSPPLASQVKVGRRLYLLGYGFLFFCLRCIYRSMEQPKIIGSAAALFGYLQGLVRRESIVLPPDVVHYLRAEQKKKLRQVVNRLD
jgi:glycosyltransferase involved in cell wall biosynthesis